MATGKRRNPDFRVDLPRLVESHYLPKLSGSRVAITEDEIAFGYRMADNPPRTAGDGPGPDDRPITPVDWDLAVGEPVARGRFPAEGDQA